MNHRVYTPPKKISLPYKFLCGYWLFFFLFDPGQIRYRASVRLSSCFFFLTYTPQFFYPPPNEICGYAPGISYFLNIRPICCTRLLTVRRSIGAKSGKLVKLGSVLGLKC